MPVTGQTVYPMPPVEQPRVDIEERWVGGGDTTGVIGVLGWQRMGTGSPTTAAIAPAVGFPGGRRFSTSATSGHTVGVYLSSTVSAGGIVASDVELFVWQFRIQSLVSETFRAGLFDNTPGAATAQICIKFDPSVSAKFQTISSTGAGTETTTTSVADVVADTRYRLEVRRDIATGTLSWTLNGVALVSHTLRLPTTETLHPFIHIVTNENVAKSFEPTYFRLRSVQLSAGY